MDCLLYTSGGCAGFEGERALAGRGAEFIYGEALMDGFGAIEAIEAGCREDECVALLVVELAQAGVYISSDFCKVQIGPKSEQHGAAAGAGGADAGAERKHVKAPEFFADEGIASVGARRNSLSLIHISCA